MENTDVVIYSILISLLFLLIYAFPTLKTVIRRIYYTNKLQGPGRFPLGVTFELFCDDEALFKKIRFWSTKHGPVYNAAGTFLFPCINISDAEVIEKIISKTKHIKKAGLYNFLTRWLGKGLLTSTGSKWHTRRKILTPAFHFSILQNFVMTFNSETKILVDILKKETEKPWTNVVPYMSQYTLCSIAEGSMGTSLNTENKEDKNYMAAIHELGKISIYRLKRPWTYFNFLFYNFIPTGWKETSLIKTLHSFTDKIIAEKTTHFEKFVVPAEDSFASLNRKKLALLDLMLNAKHVDAIIDDDGIKEEVNTFMFEGHDTTSAGLCFLLMLLANYRNYQDQIYQEILTVLGDTNKSPNFNDLNELKFMERCIKESLRLYPSVPFIGRLLEEDIVIGDSILAKGVAAHIHIFDVHRDPRHWPDPEKFDPDRFLPDNCIGRHPFAFIPFSAGPRNCIGQKFAMLEMKTVLCGILRNFILEPVDTPESMRMVIDIILRNRDDTIKVKFCPRNC